MKNKDYNQQDAESTGKQSFVSLVNENFNWVIVLIVFLIFVLSYFFLLKPKQEDILELSYNQKKQLNQEYNSNVRLLGGLLSLEKAYKEINPSYIEKVNYLVPEVSVHEELFTQINQIAQSAGLLVGSISIDFPDQALASSRGRQQEPAKKAPEKTGLVKVDISVSEANYYSFQNLLVALERNLRLVDIESLSFNPSGNSISMTFYTYYFKG